MAIQEREEKTGEVDWKQLILANWELLNSLARRRFGDSPLAEEAALAVMNRLLEKDGERLKGYAGRGSPSAFLAAVSWRLIEDFCRSRYGRRRPPLWIRHLGGIWERLYTLLCLERLDIMEAVAMVSQGQNGVGMAAVEEAAWTVRQQVVDCGAHQGLEVEYDDETQHAASGCRQSGPQVERLETRDKEELFAGLFSALTDLTPEHLHHTVERLAVMRISLKPEDRLLLQLCFRDDVPVARAAEMLGINRHQAHGRLRRLLARLRQELERVGLDRDILDLLQ